MFHSEGSPSWCVISKTTEVLACQVRAEAVLYLLGFEVFLAITSPLYHRRCAPDVTIRAKFLGMKPCPLQETLETHKSLGYVTFFFFFFGCVGSSLLPAGFSPVATSGDYSLGAVPRPPSHCSGFSCCRAQPLQCRLNSCGAWA